MTSHQIPTGSELARPFVPTNDLAKSVRFYEALGFEKLLDTEVAIFGIGQSRFILANATHEDMAGHFMMQLMVDNLDAWWTHIQTLNLPEAFGVPAPRPPAVQPWGLRIVYMVDPSGVLWHVAERRPDKPHD